MEEDRPVLEYRWKKMQKQYGTFFTALMNAPTVSVQMLKEKKLLQRSLKELKLHVEELARLLTAIETNKKKLIKYELQEARNRDWRQERRISRRNRRWVPGFHALNCPQCNQTCILCPVKDDQNAGIIGGLAGVLGGLAAGEAARQAANRAAASSFGVAASVGHLVTRFVGGSVAATEVVATAGIPLILVGGVVGITIGALAGAACGNMITLANSCNFFSGRGEMCGERGCLHSLSQHLTERERIVEQVNVKYEINDDLKELYDVAVSKKNDAMAKIVSGRQKVILKKRQATEDFVWIVIRTKTLTRISQELQQVNPSELLDQVIAEIRLGHPEHIHHGIHVLNLLKKSIKMVNVSDDEDVSGNCDMVMKLMENIPHES
ncbi:hypothetical protein Pmani_032115 [Petrolisthes manimaculis]|uniref:Uncharacterized protein n=1 Tax=Petrolisthes manimaculis TaxID=1843537 RepID=A0AAE1NSD3_9EUCA|nr:hypothetical protein Pmani_032115 [Petrolisthes manimaculis]